MHGVAALAAGLFVIQIGAQRTAVVAPALLTVDYPPDGAVFPPEITPPTFMWRDAAGAGGEPAGAWAIAVDFADGSAPILRQVRGERMSIPAIDPRAVSATNRPPAPTPEQAAAWTWMPDAATWEEIKKRSVEHPATVEIGGLGGNPPRMVSRGRVVIETSKDPAGAPIFFRDVPLMPSEVEKGVIKPLAPAGIPLIAWRLRYVGETQSRLLLEGLHTCTNCHSFSRDGKTLGVDVDGPENDKGTYAIAPVAPRMSIGVDDVITWNSFTDKPPGHHTIGFLSQISPDGQYAVTTLNEELYVANFTDYRFLQVFYPTRGILAYYNRVTHEMKAVPGADDPRYVQTDGVWSPDGKYLVFARAEARDPYPAGRKLAEYAGDPNELPIQYDLYRVPFNGGKGGRPEPIRGASANGMSNTFPKVSPDGRWIVFVQCRNGQLMRPDSQLYIVPAEGGEARRMRCNTSLMNSWHSFSPNGRWLVFSSKSRSPYTKMFLTHLDEEGRDSPPILIENATASNRAVNIPEFVNIPLDGLLKIDVPAAEFYRLFDSALELEGKGQHADAVAEWRKALTLDSRNAKAYTNLGIALWGTGERDQAVAAFRQAVELNPNYAAAQNNLGAALVRMESFDEAAEHLRVGLDINPDSAEARSNLGVALMSAGRLDEAIAHLEKVVEANPKSAQVHDNLGRALAIKGKLDEAGAQWQAAAEIDAGDAEARFSLGDALYRQGKVEEALARWRQGLAIQPTNLEVVARMAWVLSTSREAPLRNGAEALELARRAVDLAGPQDPAVLDVLAAAYAETGRFPEAVETERRALDLASRQNKPSLAQAVKARAALYEAGTPFRDAR
jgi:tetratricopeptide (TPR) repeat protein